MREAARDAEDEVEEQVLPVAIAVLDVVAEDEEVDHVAQEVEEVGVEEHGGEEAVELLPLEYLGGDLAEAPEEAGVEALHSLPDEDEAVHRDERPRDQRRRRGLVSIVERKHLITPIPSKLQLKPESNAPSLCTSKGTPWLSE